MNKNKQAFTLVELIVVIAIIAILGTIAFISLQGYSAFSRDSVRISDVSNMKTSLELFHLNAGKYPLPDNYEIVDYGGEILWYQGTFGSIVVRQLSRNLTEIPTDSLTDKEYIYSVSNNKNEFQILNLLEGDLVLKTINQTNAAGTSIRLPRLDGQYNGVFIKTLNYIVPTPSIIISETIISGSGLTLDNTNIKSQIITGGENIPNTGNINTATGKLNITLSVYSGPTITSLSPNSEKIALMKAIQGAYTGSELANSDIYKIILNTSDNELPALSETIILDRTNSVTAVESTEAPTSIHINHSTRNKTFTFTWTAGNNSGGSCKLQYYKNGITWTNISETIYNCDTTLINQSVTLPGDGWNSNWSSVQVRIIRTSDSVVLGTFPENLTCSNIAGSISSTLNIDEDCNGQWDNISGIGDWVLVNSDNTYYYGFCDGGSQYTCGNTFTQCQIWANSIGNKYVTALYYSSYAAYCCYSNPTGCTVTAQSVLGFNFTEAHHYIKSDGSYN